MEQSLAYELSQAELEESLQESDSPYVPPRKKPVYDKKRKSKNKMKKRSKQINRRK